MIELFRTNDLVMISWISALLADSGVEALVLDAHASAIEGSIGAIQRRVVVADEDYDRAKRLLDAARPA
jgi:hypothetical protein